MRAPSFRQPILPVRMSHPAEQAGVPSLGAIWMPCTWMTMFERLTARLNQVFAELRRHGKLTEGEVDLALREVRLALLEADVHFGVVKTLIARVRERAVGAAVSRALNPAQQVIKIVHEELIATLGTTAPLNLSGPKPRTLMLVGLQGSGKTTAAAKLAKALKSTGERVMLVAGDP